MSLEPLVSSIGDLKTLVLRRPVLALGLAVLVTRLLLGAELASRPPQGCGVGVSR